MNNDESLRMINDLSFPVDNPEVPSVNSMVDKHNFDTSWDDFFAVISYFRQHFNERIQLAIYDWEKAYRQAGTREEEWKYLAIKDFQNRIWMDIAVPFGGVAGCGTFGKVADAWRLIIQAHN